jgi:mono/diheme cytochrome c family protein
MQRPTPSIRAWAATLLCLLGLPAATVAADTTATVAGVERLLRDPSPANSRIAGEILLAELNCIRCHQPPDRIDVSAKAAPELTSASSRLQPAYFRRYLADPQAVKPGTTMPHVLHAASASERAQKAESLLHYLTSVGGSPTQQLPTIGTSARGAELFHQVGCAACHGEHRDGAAHAGDAVPLTGVDTKYTLPGLTAFLQDPLHVRPGGRMPSLNLTSEEAHSIAAFLLKLPEVARMRFAYYEGSWNELPDFAALEPQQRGGTERMDVNVARRRDQFGLRFEAYLRIERPGLYRFHLGSDDGSRLVLDGREIIDHGSIHAYSQKSAQVKLEPGLHPLIVDYFEQGGEERLTLELEGPDVPRQPIDAWISAEKNAPQVDLAALQIELQSDLVAEGRRWFAELGCASCHDLQQQGQRVASTARPAPRIDGWHTDRGCLAIESDPGAPRYALSPLQRKAIIEASKAGAPAASSADRIHRMLATFNCYACHERSGIGGVGEERNALFASTTPEMGDEGRVPPTLNGVGGKMTTEALRQVLDLGAKDRPYMLTRMPRFHDQNVGRLVELLAAADAVPPAETVAFESSAAEIKEAGRAMVGDTGFGCIKCHTFGQFSAQGIQSLDLRVMTRRLNRDWFQAYMRNPQQFRPGTRMPSAWPPSGKSLLDEYFEGDVQRQIAAIWEYLSDAERAKIPAGLVTPAMELVPVEQALIYRNFIAGAGTRAIGVGYPEGIHQAFDANQLRIALLWQGRFLDASRHWTGRGEGFEGPAGDRILSLVDGAPLALLATAEQPWPGQSARELGFRFQGYRLTGDQRPTFQYTFGDVTVEDFLDTRNLAPDDPAVRTLMLSSAAAPADLWWRAAVGRIIHEAENDWYVVDDQYRLQIRAGGQPRLRSSQGRSELLVPIVWRGGKARIVERIAWQIGNN